MATPQASDGSDFEQMFDLAPVSLWLEDYSGLKSPVRPLAQPKA
jgi:hypothetical protein